MLGKTVKKLRLFIIFYLGLLAYFILTVKFQIGNLERSYFRTLFWQNVLAWHFGSLLLIILDFSGESPILVQLTIGVIFQVLF